MEKKKMVKVFDLITLDEAANYMSLSPTALSTLAGLGGIPYVPFGRYIRFDKPSLDQWVKNRTTMPMPPPPRKN